MYRECDKFKKCLQNSIRNFFFGILLIIRFFLIFSAVDCGGLSFPMNGSISGNLTVYPNIVTFSCDAGFVLHGSSVRKCLSTGTWDGYKTVCKGFYLY